ncbi:unnamed protein product [Dicrocoelium dendriticum]|nr:unnamed protein product [Dicrocoelium dendriticum]
MTGSCPQQLSGDLFIYAALVTLTQMANYAKMLQSSIYGPVRCFSNSPAFSPFTEGHIHSNVSSKRTEVKTTDEARNECIQKESVRPRLLTEFCTGSATKHGASPTPEPESKTSSGASTEQKSSGSDSNDVTETKPTNVLSLDEQLEAELAREVDSMVLITSANDPQVDELDRELELELLSELNQMQKT